jgi:hypothetical protein
MTALLQLLNLILPAVSNFVLLIKDESGNTTAILGSATTANAADIAQIQAWLAAHGSTTTTAPVAAPANPATTTTQP